MNDEAPTPAEDREPEIDAPVQEAAEQQRPMPPRPERPKSIGATKLPENSDVATWSPAQGAMARAAGLVFVFPDYHPRKGEEVIAPPPVVERFLAVCRRTGLDPLARQVYCIGRTSKSDPSGVEWSIQTGIDGFLVVAERTGEYRGRSPFQWLTAKREWVDVFIPGPNYDGDHPLAARAIVHRAGWERPVEAVAEWNAYVQTKTNGEPVQMWKKQGPGQLAKCAFALALRTTFPQDLSGVYTDDEQGGVREAIEAGRREELEEATQRWQEQIEATDLDDLPALDAEMRRDGSNASAEDFAALLSRKATLLRDRQARTESGQDAASVDASQPTTDAPASAEAEDAPTPQAGAQRRDDGSMMADDPDWQGAPCPVCDFRHDITDHDDDEFTEAQALHQRAQSKALAHQREVDAEKQAAPARRKAFDSRAMGGAR